MEIVPVSEPSLRPSLASAHNSFNFASSELLALQVWHTIISFVNNLDQDQGRTLCAGKVRTSEHDKQMPGVPALFDSCFSKQEVLANLCWGVLLSTLK